MGGQVDPDRVIAEIATRQHGVVARRQLVTAGLSHRQIDRRIESGRLHVLFRGVYAVGHRVVGAAGRWWAAVLACGDGAVLSHFSAAHAWQLRPSAAAVVDVSVGRSGRLERPGIRLHRRRFLCIDDVTVLDGLPITTPARTVLDLAAAGLRGARLEAVVDVAVHERLDFGDLERLLASRQAGTAALREVIRSYAPGSVDVRSGLEVRFLELCSHRSPGRLSEDRERDASLTLAGIPFLRFSYEQIVNRPGYIVRTLGAALGST